MYQGGFVKGPNSWLARIVPRAGEPSPEPGSEALLTLAGPSAKYRKPVPVTLVELVDQDPETGITIWKFVDGHNYSELPNPIENSPGLQAEAAEHPHQRGVGERFRPRRPGQIPRQVQYCLTPIEETRNQAEQFQEPQEPVDPDNPEGYDFGDPRHPYWQ